MTLDNIIKEYIASSDARRIVIPGVGAFIKRSGGELAFVDILRTDDGVLAGEVARRKAISADKATAKVAKYASALKSELDKGRTVTIAGLGAIFHDGGRLAFAPEVGDSELVMIYMPDNSEQMSETERELSMELGQVPCTEQETENTNADYRDAEANDEPEAADETSQPEAANESAEPESAYVPRIHIRQQTRKRKRTDAVMIIAILALLAAIAVVVYGLLVGNQIPN